MTSLDLRPLSLGEILDRTFTIYRNHFLLFIGISAIPHLLVLAVSLVNLAFQPLANTAAASFGSIGTTILLSLGIILFSVIAYVFSQGGTVFAVSELYLGRSATIIGSLSYALSEVWTLFGVLLLNGIVIGIGFICLIVPGIYLACRLLVCVPATLVEKRGPAESLSRSFELTRDNVGRALLILLLSVVISWAASAIFTAPFTILMMTALKNPEMMRVWAALTQVGSSVAAILISPILLIATSIFYFDLRVRKEAFDLQFMMDPNSQRTPPGSSGIPSIL